MYAIVEIAGKQYTVIPNEVVEVDLVEGKVGDTLTFDRVLLTCDDKEKVKIGTPTVGGAIVKAKIIEHKQGEKIDVRRYKSKVRYRKHTGFRAQLTKLQILSVGAT